MRIAISTEDRKFDGRRVYWWQLIDDAGRVRDAGCELTEAAAKRAGQQSIHAQGPDLLLDMLECRRR